MSSFFSDLFVDEDRLKEEEDRRKREEATAHLATLEAKKLALLRELREAQAVAREGTVQSRVRHLRRRLQSVDLQQMALEKGLGALEDATMLEKTKVCLGHIVHLVGDTPDLAEQLDDLDEVIAGLREQTTEMQDRADASDEEASEVSFPPVAAERLTRAEAKTAEERPLLIDSSLE